MLPLAQVLKVGIENDVIVVSDARTKRRDKETFIWRPDNTVQHFVIDFGPQQWPFLGQPSPQPGSHGHPVKLTIDPTKPALDYKYSVAAVPFSGPQPPLLDPHILVEDQKGGDIEFENGLKIVELAGQAVFNAVVAALEQQHNQDSASGDKKFFFPFGVQTITVGITVESMELNITVSGTTPS